MKVQDEASPQEVRDFYASDLDRRVSARVEGNLRIDKAVDFMTSRIEEDSRVLDIGCGIGIATEEFAKSAHDGHVWGIDISPAHIDYCKRTISRDNISFRTVDAVREFDALEQFVGEKLDVICLVDVIEHLPREMARDLFERLTELLADDGKILMTYPSPVFQRHLYETDGRIQSIDLILELDDIVALADRADSEIRYFSYVDVWRRNQYVHCELARDIKLVRFGRWEDWPEASLAERSQIAADYVREKARKALKPLNKLKYVVLPSKK